MPLHLTDLPHVLSLLLWAPALSWLLTLRLGMALASFPLLYRALGEEGQGWGGGPVAVARRAGFAALGAFVLFTLTANWIPEERSPEQGRGFQSFATGSYMFRLGFTPFGQADAAGGESIREKALKDLRAAVERTPENVHYRRYLGIALADAGKYPEALAQIRKGLEPLAERAPIQARDERRLWGVLFGSRPPSRADIEAARAKVQQYRLGWIGRVGVIAGARRLGPNAVPPDLRRSVATAAGDYFRRLILTGAFVVLIIPQLGLIVLGVAWVLIRTGVLKAAPRVQQPVGAVLWESFILMMAMGVSPVLWLLGGKRPSPETAPALIAALLLARDVLQVAAVGYLWHRLRRRGLTLAEIGLERRHLASQVLTGILAALVIIPSAYVVNLLTQTVSDRFFPNIAPPYHPLQGMTAASGSVEIRWALFLAAVVGAPLLEEIFFRGALYGALRRRFGVGTAIAASSAFFAILHPQLPLGFLPIALLGAAFCALYEWRQSLVPGMVAHAINNGLAFLMLTLLFPRQG
ncbi:MAG: type II CAAX prenyl endopeptidase Rce1 family protein [Actinomycetota bacterium]